MPHTRNGRYLNSPAAPSPLLQSLAWNPIDGDSRALPDGPWLGRLSRLLATKEVLAGSLPAVTRGVTALQFLAVASVASYGRSRGKPDEQLRAVLRGVGSLPALRAVTLRCCETDLGWAAGDALDALLQRRSVRLECQPAVLANDALDTCIGPAPFPLPPHDY